MHADAFATRWFAAQTLGCLGWPRRNRAQFFGNEHGLRVLAFHDTPECNFARFKRIVHWCQAHYDIARPEDVDALLEGTLCFSGRDRILFTFDDGYANNFTAGKWLTAQGIQAVFFVVPSFFGRSTTEFLAYHRRRGIIATDFTVDAHPTSHVGMTADQARELAALGHRVAGHNFAHRCFSTVRSPKDLDYEINLTAQSLEELLGTPLQDFAISFGHPENLSSEATSYLQERFQRVYTAVRGLNTPTGSTPNFLLRDFVHQKHPFAYTKFCLAGGADAQHRNSRAHLVQRVGALSIART